MTHLYSCRSVDDAYRITKFDTDLNVESSYICTPSTCECPAGERPTCRHRLMLPEFIHHNRVNTGWLYDHDRGGWVDNRTPDEVDLSEDVREAAHNEPALDLSEDKTLTLNGAPILAPPLRRKGW